MNDSKLEGLSSEEGKKKAESLFSKKFLEYLSNKNISSGKTDKSHSHVFEKKSSNFPREYSASSDETTASESSRKSGKRGKRVREKKTYWDYHYLRNRFTQCSLQKSEEEVAPPDELKPLLMNMTILLQDIRQPSSELENLYNLISKITILVTEFIRRPLKKIPDEVKGEHSKNLEKAVGTMMALLEEYKNGPNLDPDNSIREYKRIEKEIAVKDLELGEIGKKLSVVDAQKNDPKPKDLAQRVRSSIFINEKLKAEIKFNQNHVKKYKKVLIEKEWTKHKLETELNHFKKKISKVEFIESDNSERQANVETKSENYLSARNKSLSIRGKMSKSIFKTK